MWIKFLKFPFQKMCLKMSSAKPFYFGFNVLLWCEWIRSARICYLRSPAALVTLEISSKHWTNKKQWIDPLLNWGDWFLVMVQIMTPNLFDFRRISSVMFDVRHIEINATKFNMPDSFIVKQAKFVCELCLRCIRLDFFHWYNCTCFHHTKVSVRFD